MEELELTTAQKSIADFILYTVAPGKHCARSAIVHLENSWRLRSVDPAMSVFRSITAVEESTTAIFHTLKRRGYKGADNLQARSHAHKAALRPFLLAIESNFAQSNLTPFSPALEFRGSGTDGRILIRFTVPDSPEEERYGYPQPPLHFALGRNGVTYDFSDELKSIAETHNEQSILKYVKELANRRNTLLYASSAGVPKVVDLSDGFLMKQRDIVFQHLTIYLLIDPYAQQQLFVQQCLDAFLKMLDILPDDSSIDNENAAT